MSLLLIIIGKETIYTHFIIGSIILLGNPIDFRDFQGNSIQFYIIFFSVIIYLKRVKDLINEDNIVCYKPFRNEGTLKRTDNKIQMLLNPVGFGLGHNLKRHVA